MRKQILVATLGLLTVGFLAGCNQQASSDSYHKSAAQFKDQGSKSKKAPKAKKNAKSASTDEQHKIVKFKPYKVPAKEAASKDYVKNGNLTKNHQFTYDKAGTKVSLAKTQPTKQVISNGSVQFKFTQIRIMQNQPKTKAAIKMAQQALNTDSINGSYDTLQIKYTVTNRRKQTVNIDGLTAIQANNGETLTPATQMYDAGAGTQLTSGSHKSVFAMALIKHPEAVKRVKVEIGGIYTPDGKTLAKPTTSHYLKVK